MNLIESLFKRKPTETKEGLPILTEETRIAFMKEIDREVNIRGCPGSILTEWLGEIGKENPEFVNYARVIVREYPREIQGAILTSIFYSYRILKSQALNDKILEYWNKPTS